MEDRRLLVQHDAHQPQNTAILSRHPSFVSELDDAFDGPANSVTRIFHAAHGPQGTELLQLQSSPTNLDDHDDDSTGAPTVQRETIPFPSRESGSLRPLPMTPDLDGTHEPLLAGAHSPHALCQHEPFEPGQSSSSITEVGSLHIADPGSDQSSRTDGGWEANHTHANSAHVYLTPFWLRKRTLLALIALFAGLTIGLIVLWVANEAQNGFPTTLSTNHYAWT